MVPIIIKTNCSHELPGHIRTRTRANGIGITDESVFRRYIGKKWYTFLSAEIQPLTVLR